MKIFGWMQSKLNGKQQQQQQVTGKAANTVVVANSINHMAGQLAAANTKEEFSDWPQSLLAIGTFGNSRIIISSDPTPTPEQEEEEDDDEEVAEEDDDDDRVSSNNSNNNNNSEINGAHLQSSGAMMCRAAGKDMILDQNYIIRKKSLSFLFKKIFTSSRNKSNSGIRSSSSSLNHHVSLVVTDSLRDPTSSFRKSRSMEKILRALLNKKIHPQTSCTASKPVVLPNKYLMSSKDCISSMSSTYSIDDEQVEGNINEGSTWVKTDSEYIVLEI